MVSDSIQKRRMIAGIAIWIFLGGVGAWYLFRDLVGSQHGTARQMGTFLFAPRQTIELRFPTPQLLNPSESIFERRGGKFVRIGEIVSTTPLSPESAGSGWTQQAIAEIYSDVDPIRTQDQMTYIPASESMSWVVSSMLTPERRARINQLVQEAYLTHHREIAAHFQPIIEQTLRDASIVIWEDLQRVAGEYHIRWQQIGERYRAELVEQRFVPLLRYVIWPIVLQQAAPLVNQIGEEIWSRASIWRFGWRAMYDMLPLPQSDLTRQEFERFVQSDALPILENHIGDILELQQRIFAAIAQNPQVQQEVAASLQHILQDEEAQQVAIEMLQRVVVNNPRLNQTIFDIWSSPRAKQAVELTNARLEYTIAAIGEELFGNPYTAITPEFSRVLRFKVLHKDCHWLLLERGPDDADKAHEIVVRIGADSIENPFHVPAEKRN